MNGAGASKSQDIGNIGGGLLGDFNVPVNGYYQNIQLSSQYIHSYVTDTDILNGTLLVTPDFPFPGVGIAYNPNDGPVSMLLKPQAKFLTAASCMPAAVRIWPRPRIILAAAAVLKCGYSARKAH